VSREPARRRRWTWLPLLFALFVARGAAAQAEPPPVQRDVELSWDTDKGLLYLDMGFRDIIDDGIRNKLSRGLPTTIVLTATIQRAGSSEPLSSTTQTCRITWHVWEEAYYVEIVRPGSSQARWTTTLEGVLRRCAEVHRLLAGDATQVSPALQLYARGTIQINPVSAEVLQKLKRWVMRPSSTGTAAPGDALFSTFAGLFMQRIGDAEHEVHFFTRPRAPARFSSKAEERRAQ
jgi:hypothetical protein